MNHPIPLATLVEYWLGELAPQDEQRLEEHLLGCSDCSERLGELVQLGAAVSAAFRRGTVRAVLTPALLAKMRSEGLRLREYRLSSGAAVQCTIGAEDDAVVGRLQVPLAGVTRIDLVRLDAAGNVRFRLPDIPFDPAAGEVLFCPSAARLKKEPAHTDIVRLIAVDEAGERLLGEYTFVHSPATSLP